MRDNIHTWVRLTRLDIQNFSVALGNAALKERLNWPPDGSGRAVKAATEEVNKSLEGAFDRRDLNYPFDIIESAISTLQKLTENAFFIEFVSDKAYFDRAGKRSTFGEVIKNSLPHYSSRIQSNRPPRKSAAPDRPREYSHTPSIPDASLDEVVPAQKLAPLQFTISEGKLRIKRQSARIDSDERQLLTSGRTALQADANSVIDALSDTNVDPRFSAAFAEMREVLSSDSDIIRLGMLSNSCNSLVHRFEEQLPDIIFAKLEAFGTNLAMFVSQFPDWQKFSANARESAVVDQKDVAVIFSVGTELAESLKVAEQLVDPKVPKSLKLLLEAIRDPAKSTKRAVFGLIRTLENLIATILRGFGSFVGASFAGAKEGAKSSTKAVVAVGILTSVAVCAANLSPSVSQVIQSNWLAEASQIVQKAMKE